MLKIKTNWYERSRRIFINKLRENPKMTREKWDKYAHENCLFSALTLEANILNEKEWIKIAKKDLSRFDCMVKKIMPIVVKNKDKKWRLNGKFIRKNKKIPKTAI